MQNMKPCMELRIWEKSSLIGKKISNINSTFNVSIIKVARGKEASNPKDDLIIEAADYISFIGNSEDCLNLLKESAPSS